MADAQPSTSRIAIRWQPSAVPGEQVVYLVDDGPVGADDAGFDRVLDALRARPGAKVVVVLDQPGSLGGESLIGSLPFARRFKEFEALVGSGRVSFESR
jgi:hypothetical protein